GMGDPHPVLCTAADDGCVIESADEAPRCRSDVGTCDDTFERGCFDDVLATFCFTNQIQGIDCVAFGGSCSAADAKCVDIPAGNACDLFFLECEDGLECSAGVCTAP